MSTITIELGTSGCIDIQQLIREDEQERQRLAEWAERAHRHELRREESEVLRAWWRADETARRTIESNNRGVFARIRANRKWAVAIRKAERDSQDARMLALGYEIREGDPSGVRYFRPRRGPGMRTG
jgi:hypothetical protein